uniref:BK_channel_a domain-containing protein n=1 Tax=Angiostrongylus cantonensis TaxID=6313 RepID=A0A0K0CWE3_ANGCA
MEATWIKNFCDDLYLQCTLASESSIEDLLMQARMIRYDVIGLVETRRRHPFNAVYDTGEELFLGTCDSRGVGFVGVLVNTSLSMNIDSFEQLTTRTGRLRLKRCGSTPALTIIAVYAPTSNYDKEEVEPFYMDLERFYREDHTFFKNKKDCNVEEEEFYERQKQEFVVTKLKG